MKRGALSAFFYAYGMGKDKWIDFNDGSSSIFTGCYFRGHSGEHDCCSDDDSDDLYVDYSFLEDARTDQ
ncbi:unnamed protein product [Commensalibacter communis]|uniref:Uncharacterized protein n=1 Tax=Commensalibacter communis TaxID=2972786 RepID=A0A9W4TRL5_9PROT|nr:unnamed protein product [Commensalibacter communis]CAI3958383.1 unnamed protein product [Commensalibacter communis]CAI3959623.1 unnamed protein product [Commensalibacter communis]CAI3961585.1 unnamed protein product [Commensalibacter communis]